MDGGASYPQFAMVVPHLRTVPPLAARCSVAAHCASLRVLATSALRASDVRKLTRGFPCLTGVFVPACASLARYSGAAERFALSSPLHPFGASTATACFRHWRRPSCASSIQHGRPAALTSSLAALPASLGLLRPVSRTARGLRAPQKFFYPS